MLRDVIQRKPAYTDAYILLGKICEEQGKVEEAGGAYRQALANQEMPERDRYRINAMLQRTLKHD